MSDHPPSSSESVSLPSFNVDMKWVGLAAVVGVIGLVLTFVGGQASPERGLLSYLLGFIFCTTIALGTLTMLLSFHASTADWVVGIRRIIETCATSIVPLSLFAIPLLLEKNTIWHWMNGLHPTEPTQVMWFRQWYLSPGFFIGRTVFYFALWSAIAILLYRWSRRLDVAREPGTFGKMVKLGSAGMPLIGLTGTFAAFDWLMSLDADWSSTMFGAYVMAGSYLAGMGLVSILAHWMRQTKLKTVFGETEFHNLGKLLFAMVCFWAYLGYSQYMLIWIANMPVEISWFMPRTTGPWHTIFFSLIFLHFVVPFLALLGKPAKLKSWFVIAIGFLILVNHFIDMSWLIIPSMKGAWYTWTDFTAVLGIGGIQTAFILYRFRGVVVAPQHDPAFTIQAA